MTNRNDPQSNAQHTAASWLATYRAGHRFPPRGRVAIRRERILGAGQ